MKKKKENGKDCTLWENNLHHLGGGGVVFFFFFHQFCQVGGLAIIHKRNEPNVENSSSQC
jgi:hypothetical protein